MENKYNEVEFSYKDKIVEYYSFENRSSLIYCKLDDDTLDLLSLHEYDKQSGEEFLAIFEDDEVFSVTKSNGNITNAISTTIDDFLTLFQNKFSPKNNYACINLDNCIPIVVESQYINPNEAPEIAKSFRTAYTKYMMAENAIPTQLILNDILSIVHRYVATNELDTDGLLETYTRLQNFKEFCYSSIKCIEPFVKDPSSIDLQHFTEELQSKIKNIDNIINIYLEKELQDGYKLEEKGD